MVGGSSPPVGVFYSRKNNSTLTTTHPKHFLVGGWGELAKLRIHFYNIHMFDGIKNFFNSKHTPSEKDY